MATNISVFLTQVKILIGPDDANLELSDAELQALIKAAVESYSRDAPDEVTADITGDDGKYYDIAGSLTSWVEGFSHIVELEYPAATVASDETPQLLDDSDWRDDYWDGSTRYLFFPNHAPSSSETIRVTYTAPYTFDESDDITTPTQDFYAICNLAACLACRAIATKYSRTSDSTIASDSVNHPTRAAEFSARAAEYCGIYSEEMGLVGEEGGQLVPAAGDFVDWDTEPGWPSHDFLFHGKRTR